MLKTRKCRAVSLLLIQRVEMYNFFCIYIVELYYMFLKNWTVFYVKLEFKYLNV